MRGFEVEGGEIEALLTEHPQVSEVAVVVREDVPGVKRIAAYVVPVCENGGEGAPEARRPHQQLVPQLREYLRGRLPDWMVPAAWIVLERLPLNARGTLDRDALPTPQPASSSAEYAPPVGEVERMLVELWQELLGVPRVGRDDNFFELGGHSLLGLKLFGRVADKLNMMPPPVSIYRYPTVREMSPLIETLLSQSVELMSPEQSGMEQGVI